MKKSEFKEYLKTEILKMSEASQKDVDLQKDLNAELEKTKALMADMMEGKVKKSEFKEYLRNEILREMNEQEEDDDLGGDLEDIGDVDVTNQVDFDIDPTEDSDADELDTLSDDLVDLAKKAKDAGAIELANQILNSAKFANKTKIKSAEKQAGLDQEG